VNYFDLKKQFAQSLTLRLLRAESVPLVMAVLFAGFKRDHRPTVPESRLRPILESQLEELCESEQLSGTKPVREYLADWSDMTVAAENGAILAVRKGPVVWLRNGPVGA
jgi:hypothetical protein